jgi:hypothetical protein
VLIAEHATLCLPHIAIAAGEETAVALARAVVGAAA